MQSYEAVRSTPARSIMEYAWTDELDSRLAESWDALAAENTQVPLHRYREWYELLCRERVITPWKIVLISENGRPIGLFPLYHSHPWRVRVVDEFATFDAPMLLANGWEDAALTELAHWFRRQTYVWFLSLGRCADQGYLDHVNALFLDCGITPAPRPLQPIAKLPVPESWEAYLASLGASTRAKVRHLEDRLYRDYPAAHVAWITAASSAGVRDEGLDALVRLHQQRWHHHWSGSAFDKEHNSNFFLKMMRWALRRDAGMLAVLRLGRTTLAAATLLHIPGQHTGYCAFLARDEHALPGRYGIGKIIVCQAIRWAMQRHIRELNMADGTMEYKQQLGGILYAQHDLLFSRYAALARCPRPLDILYDVFTHPLSSTLHHIGDKLHEKHARSARAETPHARRGGEEERGA